MSELKGQCISTCNPLHPSPCLTPPQILCFLYLSSALSLCSIKLPFSLISSTFLQALAGSHHTDRPLEHSIILSGTCHSWSFTSIKKTKTKTGLTCLHEDRGCARHTEEIQYLLNDEPMNECMLLIALPDLGRPGLCCKRSYQVEEKWAPRPFLFWALELHGWASTSPLCSCSRLACLSLLLPRAPTREKDLKD